MRTTNKPGILAPDFTPKTERARALTLSDLRGRTVVLYFYPVEIG